MKYERLTRKDGTRVQHSDCVSICENDYGKRVDFMEAYNRLAELEDKIEDGTLVELPCKVGDTVYYNNYPRTGQVVGIAVEVDGIWLHVFYDDGLHMWHTLNEIGTTVSLTKAEAEKRLEELRGEL